MPRDRRHIPEAGFLHVISRGNNRRKIFRYERDLEAYYSILLQSKAEDRINISHYCLMSNHIHLILEVNEASNLSRFMKRVNLRYVYYYRRKYAYCGHLWQDRFKAKTIDNEEYLIQCGKYIELNPVRAGIVKRPEEYRFSSYLHYAYGAEDVLIQDNPFYSELGESQERRQTIYRDMIIEEMIEKGLRQEKIIEHSELIAV
ncbi:MAG: transposase [Candidatus Omnitrophica bacterium]|nr:transposase [Candidatus Omnitrophota bacterium]